MARGSFDELEKRLHVALPSIVRKPRGFGDYTDRIEATRILDARSAAVWGGMMLPDGIPLLGNGAGDVILARFASDGSFREFVEWHHEGCFWHPSDLVPGFEAPVAALERNARSALVSGLEKYCLENGGESLAETVGVPWATMAAWLADTDIVDERSRARIRRETRLTDSELFSQRWDRAEEAALGASKGRVDLAWPGAVLGRVAERRGDVKSADDWYRCSLRGLQTTQSFTALWNDLDSPFSVSRLRVLNRGTLDGDDHVRVCLSGDLTTVRRHWLEAGDMRLRDGRATEAYDCYMRAGWDWHFTNEMEMVLERLVRAAEAAESAAWTALARLHLESLSASA